MAGQNGCSPGCLLTVIGGIIIGLIWSCNSESEPQNASNAVQKPAVVAELDTDGATSDDQYRLLVPTNTPQQIVHGFDIANYAEWRTDENCKTKNGDYWGPEFVKMQVQNNTVRVLGHGSTMAPRFKNDDDQYLARLVRIAIEEFLGVQHGKKAIFIHLPSHYDEQITKKLRETNENTLSLAFQYGIQEPWELNDTMYDAQMTIKIHLNSFTFKDVVIE